MAARIWRVEVRVEPTGIELAAELDGAPRMEGRTEVPNAQAALDTLETWFRTCREAGFQVLVTAAGALPETFGTTNVYLAMHFIATALEHVLAERPHDRPLQFVDGMPVRNVGALLADRSNQAAE